jgi:hypothetical protein
MSYYASVLKVWRKAEFFKDLLFTLKARAIRDLAQCKIYMPHDMIIKLFECQVFTPERLERGAPPEAVRHEREISNAGR